MPPKLSQSGGGGSGGRGGSAGTSPNKSRCELMTSASSRNGQPLARAPTKSSAASSRVQVGEINLIHYRLIFQRRLTIFYLLYVSDIKEVKHL